MADIAVDVLFVMACASLYGLAVYLFRDQIWPDKYNAKAHGAPSDRGLSRGAWHVQVRHSRQPF